jgi:hypothetical protein
MEHGIVDLKDTKIACRLQLISVHLGNFRYVMVFSFSPKAVAIYVVYIISTLLLFKTHYKSF